MQEAILLLGHGSRDEAGNEEFRRFAAEVRDSLRWVEEPCPIVPCFLELAEPTLLDAIEAQIAVGAVRLLVMPCFLLAAGHSKNDTPSALDWARRRYPQVEIRYGRPFGVQPQILDILALRCSEGLASLSTPLREPPLPAHAAATETALLLIGRGSSDPDANSEVYKVARLLWEGRTLATVEVAFIGITFPNVATGLVRCLALGARQIIVIPYFFCTGVLVGQIARIIAAFGEQHADIRVALTGHLGSHPALIDLTLQRIRELRQGAVAMNCDCCKYRVKLPGFEKDYHSAAVSDHAHGFRRSPPVIPSSNGNNSTLPARRQKGALPEGER